MHFYHPFQCVKYLRGSALQGHGFLVGAAGAKIYTFDAESGIQLSIWPSSNKTPPDLSIESRDSLHVGHEEPGKRRKLLSPVSSMKAGHTRESPEIGGNLGVGKYQTIEMSWSTIPILAVSPSGEHVIAITAEDKCIRVFEVDHNGRLSQLSERCMPKRPCAVVMTSDCSTILCGDKFGDVYSLPFLPKDEDNPPPKRGCEALKPFQLSASRLTVHTKRNLKALEQQLLNPSTVVEKLPPSFERKLLLGHVSMLTDLAFAELTFSSPSASRGYILTSDRDEHIRVSRGPPQAHIIQNYCLGHTSFVSQLCIPPWHQGILISGGGDNFILVWDWMRGEVLQKVQIHRPPELRQSLQNGNEILTLEPDATGIAVAGIWAMSFTENAILRNAAPGAILVALEGIPKIFPYILGTSGKLAAQSPLHLSGNVLDVTFLNNSNDIIVSVDNVHEPGSTRTRRSFLVSRQVLLQAFRVSVLSKELAWEESLSTLVTSVNSQGTTELITSGDEKEPKKQQQAFIDLLYGVGNIRKRGKGEGD